MGKIDGAINWAVEIANDNSHGYSQSTRWGPHYDCSSFLITAYRNAGLDIQASYTGDMKNGFINAGFKDVASEISIPSGLKRGDVLLRTGHTVMFIGNGQIVHASSPTNGILV